MQIMLVEDGARLGRKLRQSLIEHAYTVVLATTCAEANESMYEGHFDVVVLDLSLPDGDGLDLIRQWRASGLTEPVIVLSARASEAERILGLNAGADDYLGKPFSVDELIARIRAVIRRLATARTTVLERGVIRLDLVGHLMQVCGKPIDLTAREYALLEVFMHHPGRVLTRSMISERVWSSDSAADANLLDVYMSRLRGKMERRANRPLFKTVRGIGYQLL